MVLFNRIIKGNDGKYEDHEEAEENIAWAPKEKKRYDLWKTGRRRGIDE